MKKPIILIGSERSGSNLLRVLMGNHSAIDAPPPVHFCDVFCPLVPKYRDLHQRENAIRLVGHMIRYANSGFSDWGLETDAGELVKKYEINTFCDAFEALHVERAALSGKQSWFSKDNNMHKYAFELLHSMPKARFVYLCRNPLDQVASWMRNPLFLMTPRKAIKKWVEEQQLIRQIIDVWELKVECIRYEDLIQNPQDSMTCLLESLGFGVEEACFQTSGQNREAKRFKLWENIDKPIMKENRGGYRDVLTEQDIHLIEDHAAALMDWLGYSRETQGKFKGQKTLKYRYREMMVARRNKAKAMRDQEGGQHDLLIEKRRLRQAIVSEL